MTRPARAPALPADIFVLATKAARYLRTRLLIARITACRQACMVLLRQIENDKLCMNLYPEYTNALHDQIDADHAALRAEIAKLASLDLQLIEATA